MIYIDCDDVLADFAGHINEIAPGTIIPGGGWAITMPIGRFKYEDIPETPQAGQIVEILRDKRVVILTACCEPGRVRWWKAFQHRHKVDWPLCMTTCKTLVVTNGDLLIDDSLVRVNDLFRWPAMWHCHAWPPNWEIILHELKVRVRKRI